jgi:hypothetical protein
MTIHKRAPIGKVLHRLGLGRVVAIDAKPLAGSKSPSASATPHSGLIANCAPTNAKTARLGFYNDS